MDLRKLNLKHRSRTANALLAPLFLGMVYLASALVGLLVSRGTDGIAAIWPSNAILLSALLLSKPSARRGHLVSCAIAGVLANAWAGTGPGLSVVFASANIVTVGLVLAVLRKLPTAVKPFETPEDILRFFAVIVPAVAAGATIAASAIWVSSVGDFAVSWLSWAMSDALGLMVITPLVLTSVRPLRDWPHEFGSPPIGSLLWCLLGVFIAAVVVFDQSRLPALFVPFAVLLLATYRAGVLAAIAGVFIIAGTGTLFAAFGRGPIAAIDGSIYLRIHFFQFYLATLYGTCLPLATLLSERARLARERAQSDRRHRRILDRSREIIFETDVTGRWTYLNPAWAKVTGRSVDSSIGKSFLSFLAHTDRSLALERLAPLYDRRIEECLQDLRYLCADGEIRWASVRSYLLFDEFGAITGTYGTFHDVTGRVAAQVSQANSEHLYRLLADHSNDMIVRFGMDGVRQYVSPASLAVLGYTPEELTGQPAAGAIHPDDRASVLATCRTLLSGAENPICSYRQLHKNGSHVWLEASYRLIKDPSTGAPDGFIASVRDVGRRAKAEHERAISSAKLEEANRLLLMAEGMSEIGHWRVDVATGSTYWSDIVCAIHGRPSGYMPDLEAAIAAYHPDDLARVQATVDAALEAGKDFALKARIVRPDGTIRYVRAHGRAEMGPDGATTGLFGVFQDVTDAHEAETALLAASERVVESNRMMTMAATVAHLGHWRVADTTGAYFWSDEVYRIYGQSKDFVPTFRNTLALCLPEDREHVAVTVETAMKCGGIYSFRARIRRPDQSIVHVFVRGEVELYHQRRRVWAGSVSCRTFHGTSSGRRGVAAERNAVPVDYRSGERHDLGSRSRWPQLVYVASGEIDSGL